MKGFEWCVPVYDCVCVCECVLVCVYMCLEEIKLVWFEAKGPNIDPVQCPHKDKHIPNLYVLSVSVAGKARPVLEDPDVEPKDAGSCQSVCSTETS